MGLRVGMAIHHFITGFPGFVATRLVREIAHNDPTARFTFLVEQRFASLATDRLANDLDIPGDRADVCPGDITQSGLGIEDKVSASEVDIVWHLAAVYDLAVPEARAYAVNVQGTQHVIEFCTSGGSKIPRLNYVSTCYVSGDREGTIYEDQLNTGQQHNNHYETTKFWSEVVAMKHRAEIPTTIFRPSVAVGDSRTGITDKFDGPYYLLRVLMKFPRWLPSPNFGSIDGVVNVVPIDFVAESMAHIGCSEAGIGKTFHIADPQPMKARDFAALAIDCMGRKRTMAALPTGALDRLLQWKEVEEFLDVPRELVAYFRHRARYDTTETERALQATSIRCPHASSYVHHLVDYFLRAQDLESSVSARTSS
jgi:thioester reductase-like protein